MDGTADSPDMGKDDALAALRAMVLIRRFEEKAGQMFGMGLIGGFCHLYIGQEAVVTGMAMAARPGDSAITGYRCHGHALSCGLEPEAIMAELLGRRSGVSRGRGGSMHMASPARGLFGGHAIVASQVSLGTGLAFAHQYRGDGGVALVYFGDGAADQGQVHESLNLAARWKLPAVYVIENNGGDAAPGGPTTQFAPLFERGAAFGIPGAQVNGMDVAAVRAAGVRAMAHARDGKGPALLEMRTARYRGHSMADPAKYRADDAGRRKQAEADPILRLRVQVAAAGWASEAELKAMEGKVRARVLEAAETAGHEPEPEAADLLAHVVPPQVVSPQVVSPQVVPPQAAGGANA